MHLLQDTKESVMEIREEKSLLFPQTMALFKEWKCSREALFKNNLLLSWRITKDFFFSSYWKKTQGNSVEGFTEQLWWRDTRGLPVHETYCGTKSLNSAAINAGLQFPHEFLMISTKRAERESQLYSISTSDRTSILTKIGGLILTFFSFPFSFMCFPSHCFTFPAFCFSDLSLAPFSSHPLIHYEVWSLQQCFQRKHVTSTLGCLWSCVNKCIEKE